MRRFPRASAAFLISCLSSSLSFKTNSLKMLNLASDWVQTLDQDWALTGVVILQNPINTNEASQDMGDWIMDWILLLLHYQCFSILCESPEWGIYPHLASRTWGMRLCHQCLVKRLKPDEAGEHSSESRRLMPLKSFQNIDHPPKSYMCALREYFQPDVVLLMHRWLA